MLVSGVPGTVTSTLPLVAPSGTLVVISELETTVNAASVPLKVTRVASVRSVPRIVTGRSHLAGSGQCFHEWAETNGQAEDRTVGEGGPANLGCPVESRTGVLDQPSVGLAAVLATALDAKGVKRGQFATQADFEDRPIADIKAPVGPAGGVVP